MLTGSIYGTSSPDWGTTKEIYGFYVTDVLWELDSGFVVYYMSIPLVELWEEPTSGQYKFFLTESPLLPGLVDEEMDPDLGEWPVWELEYIGQE